jgi:hypothetical protein
MPEAVLAPVAASSAEKTPALFRAEGIVRGILIPERNLLIGMDRQAYPVTIAPALRRWFMKHPEEAQKRDLFRVFPRSLKGDKLRFYVADAPSVEDEADLPYLPYRFVVSGVVLNQRSLSTDRSPDHVVVRVKPNRVVPPAEKHLPENKAHLLFLRGRVVPAAKYIGKHCTFFCELGRGELWIRGCALALESSVERFPAGAAMLPWPFRDLNGGTWAMIHRWNQLQAPFPDAPDARESLLESLKAWSQSVKAQEASVSDPLAHRDLDRQLQVSSRLRQRVESADQNQLRSLVQKRGLMQLLALITKGRPSAYQPEHLTPDPAMTTAFAPAASPSSVSEQVLDMLSQPAMDEAILWRTKLTRPQLINMIQSFWVSGRITPEMESRSRSYQLKKHKPKG